jgi:hypothetical protein
MADEAAMEAYRGNAKKLYAVFFMEAIHNPEKSAKEGRPIYDEVEFIRIMVPGDTLNVVCREVREVDKEAYATQYTAFKAKQDQPVTGTPLDKIPFLTKARVLEFHAMGLKTAEHVRDMPDSVAQKFMDAHGLRKRITTFLAAAADGAPMEKLAQLLEAVESQGKKIDELTKHQRR